MTRHQPDDKSPTLGKEPPPERAGVFLLCQYFVCYVVCMAEISVVAPRDIWDTVDGKEILVAKKGQRISFDEAVKHKIVPIQSASIGKIETK